MKSSCKGEEEETYSRQRELEAWMSLEGSRSRNEDHGTEGWCTNGKEVRDETSGAGTGAGSLCSRPVDKV